MKKKHLFIIFISVLVVFCFMAVLLVHRQNSHDSEVEEYISVFGDPTCNFSENTVLYLDDAGILHLIETSSGKDMVYCDRPNCTHEVKSGSNENPSCPAAFDSLTKGGPVLYNGHLYFIGNMTSDGGLQTQYLYEMDSNGENRKKVAVLEDVQELLYVIYRDHCAIGAYYNRIETDDAGQIVNDDKPEAGIFVIDLNTYNVYMGSKVIGEQAQITGLYYEDGIVYYSDLHFDEDITEQMLAEAAEDNFENFIYENMLHDICKYDISKKSTTLVKTLDHVENLQLLDGDAYCESREGYFVVDKESGETKELPIDTATGILYGRFVKQEETLYFARYDSDSNEVTYYRTEQGKNVDIMTTQFKDAFSIITICGQTVYVNYTDEEGNYCLGMLNRDDLNCGARNVRKLRNYNEE